ncbi:MAG: amino-acid N-acetyltransferase [Pseudomonadales bacterium]|nr:amino-acid N-acetyltransferase [Pseudomonadales bacterium]
MDKSTPQDQYVHWFRSASPYINAHRNKTFVVAFGGEAVQHPNFTHLVHDIALLDSLGIRLILVHGSRPQINQRLAESGVQSQFAENRRITDTQSLPAVTQACGYVRHQIEAALSMGIAQSPMQGAEIEVISGNFITARPYGVRDGVDFQHTGEVRKVNTHIMAKVLDQSGIILISHLGYSPTGELFNCAWEEIAEAVATSINADKLIILDETEGLMDTNQQLIKELTTSEAETLLDQQQTLPHLAAATRACKAGVTRCHLLSYQLDGALIKELFTLDGSGTLLANESYENVRSATIDDVGGLIELIEPLEQEGVLVRRSRELLETEIDQFILIERDEVIIGCAALYPFPDSGSGELACVVVHPDYRQGQRGDTLLEAIERKAKHMGLESVFVLTTRTAHWFHERGFEPSDRDQLPEQKQRLYNFQRNSKVFQKRL